jgi:hypothetical protein
MYLAIFIKLTEFYTAAMVKPGIWTKQGKGGPRGVVYWFTSWSCRYAVNSVANRVGQCDVIRVP